MSNPSTPRSPFVAPMPVIMRALGLQVGPRSMPATGNRDAMVDPPGDDTDRAA